MKHLQIRLLSSTALAALAGLPAGAQTPAVYSWTGSYIGVHAGGVNHRNRATDLDGYFTFPGLTYRLNFSGVLAGVQAGYNFQLGALVIGGEIDASKAAVSSSAVIPAALFGPGLHKTSLDSMVTARARVGFAFDHFMIYGTAGYAAAQIQNHVSDTNNAGAIWSNTAWRAGKIIGIGGEYAFAGGWRVKAEVLFADFGRQTISALPFGPPDAYRFGFKNTAKIARIGINYAF